MNFLWHDPQLAAISLKELLNISLSSNSILIPIISISLINLSMPYINVYEIATFYTMYNLAPVGKYFVQVCTTTPCLLRGANEIVKVCQNKISKDEGTLSDNGMCSWIETECLGACVNAPMIQVNNDYYEDLDKNNMERIIDSFIQNKPLKPGSFRGRKSAAPEKIVNKINGANNA